ncbi:MAG: phosphatase PAP2 family protein [Verrucomicrobiota bacterium]|nr:phosphatase PAP2 family protein [Verrucomicrobiota bacterium]
MSSERTSEVEVTGDSASASSRVRRLPGLLRAWPHEIVFFVFLALTWVRLVFAVGFLHPASGTFLVYLIALFGLVIWGQQRPSPFRWRVRLLLLASISVCAYFSLGAAVQAIYDPAGLAGNWRKDQLLYSWDRTAFSPFYFLMTSPAHPFITDLFMGCYLFFFYYLLAGPLHHFTRDIEKFRLCLTGLFCVYGVGYIGYTMMPALGPGAYLNLPTREGGLLAHWGGTFIANRCNGVDVFPSIHFAATAFLLGFDWQHYRARFWRLLLPCIGLWISTVFLHYHYFVDLAAGLVVALVALWITHRMGHAGAGGVLAEDCALDESEAEPEIAARA